MVILSILQYYFQGFNKNYMTKKSFILIGVSIFVLSACVQQLSGQPTTQNNNQNQTTDQTSDETADQSSDNETTDVTDIETITFEDDLMIISAVIPGTEKVEINAILRDYVTNYVDQFKSDYGNDDPGMLIDGMKYYLEMNYDTVKHGNSVQTIVIYISDYLGGAHGGMDITTMTFDFETGERIMMDDIFKEDSDWVTTLSDLVKEEIRKRDMGADEDWLELGAGPLKENFERFALSEDALILYFPPYYVAPYAAGPQTVEILLTKISDSMNKEYL